MSQIPICNDLNQCCSTKWESGENIIFLISAKSWNKTCSCHYLIFLLGWKSIPCRKQHNFDTWSDCESEHADIPQNQMLHNANYFWCGWQLCLPCSQWSLSVMARWSWLSKTRSLCVSMVEKLHTSGFCPKIIKI